MVLIIGGHPRSGTTLLRHLCDGHPDIFVTNEFGNFQYVGKPYKDYTLQLLRNLWDKGIVRNRLLLWSPNKYGSVKVKAAFMEVVTANIFFARFFFNIYKQREKLIDVREIEVALRSASPTDAVVVGDKLPDYVFSLDTLAEIKGLSRLIIYRDCRDVTSSTLERFRTVEHSNEGWINDLSTAEKIAKRWVRSIELMESHAERLHVIRYENLIRQPSRELEALGGWLGVDPAGFPKEMILNAGIGKYKEGLSKEELTAVMEVAGPTMARLNYV